eukprot:1803384-Rhodomonas_salina.1
MVQGWGGGHDAGARALQVRTVCQQGGCGSMLGSITQGFHTTSHYLCALSLLIAAPTLPSASHFQ